jgi:hypothetical protein
MLDETTEIRLETIWREMSEDLQKAAISAVDTSLMSDRFPGEQTGAILARVDEDLTAEIGRIISSGEGGSEAAFTPVVFGKHSADSTLGKHDERIDDLESNGYTQGFRISNPMREYIIQRILL